LSLTDKGKFHTASGGLAQWQ